MERIIEVTPAFDRRDPDPSKSYGIHGAEIRMVLKGDKGATQFVLYTNRHLSHVQDGVILPKFKDKLGLRDLQIIREYSGDFPEAGKELETVMQWCRFVEGLGLGMDDIYLMPTAADVGYHSKVPRYEGQMPIRKVVKWGEKNGDTWTETVWGDPTPCEYTGGNCYYDGSGLQAEELWLKVLNARNTDIIWMELEDRYKYWLEGNPK